MPLPAPVLPDPSAPVRHWGGTAGTLRGGDHEPSAGERWAAAAERDRFFDSVPELHCMVDTSGRFRRVNASFSRVLGWTDEELIGQAFLDFVHTADTRAATKELRKLAVGQHIVQFENRCRCKDDSWRVLSWQCMPHSNGLVYAIARDVTATSARTERELQGKAEVFHTALLALRDCEGDDMRAFCRHATQVVAEAMQVERVSIWLFDETRSAIVCEDLVYRSTGKHESGVRLTAADYPSYFREATRGRPIVADDAHAHPATCEFSAGYLTPLGITSMLDVPIIKEGNLRGVICHEHTGTARKWTPQEVEFATAASSYVTLMLVQARRRAAEARVSESEARLQRVTEAAGLGCWDWNVVTGEVASSGHWALMLGFEEEELQPSKEAWKSRIHPEDREATLVALADHLKGRTPVFSQEHRLRTRDGGWRWMLCQGRVVTRGVDGRAVHVSGIYKDIHDQRQAQEALREMNATLERRIALRTAALQESEARLRQLADGIDSAFWVADKELRTLSYVSCAYERIWGAPVESIASDPQPFVTPTHADDRERVAAQLARVSVLGGAPFELEYRIVRPDGGIRFIRNRGFPVRDKTGALLRMVGIAEDVTEKVEADRSIRQALTMLDATEDGAFIFDPASLRFTYVNQGATSQLGHSREELLRMTALDVAPEFTEASFRAMLAPLQSGEVATHQYTTRHRRKDGQDLPVEASLQYIALPGEEARCIAIVRDITHRLRMEQTMNRTQRLEAIGRLAGGVAHDLNNALAPILMGMEALRRRHPEERQMLDTFESCASRAAGMVRQLLTFARGAEGEHAPLQPARVIKELQEILSGILPKNLEIRVSCQPDLPEVIGDATQLRQILLNLCVNAGDAMPGGGTLSVLAQRVDVDAAAASTVPDAKPGSFVMMQVRDTGAGIPAEIMERIFDPFFTTKAPSKGTGLGLSSVMGLVKGHGGFVHVQSREGVGSIFSVYIPARVSEPASAPTPVKAQPAVERGEEVVLLVDDEAAIRDVGSMVLADAKFQVITAADGVEALRKLSENQDRIRAVITDQQMPHMDGLAFVRALRGILPHVPVAIGTGRLDEALTEQFRTLRVTFLEKPYSQDRLVGALRTMLQHRNGEAAAMNHVI